MRPAAFAALGAALVAVLAPASARAQGDAATAEVYQAKCQACHMADGNSPVEELNFADGKWRHGSKLADLEKVITEGVPGTAMLPFSEQLTAEQISALARYVRAFDKSLKPEKARKKK